MSESCTFGSWHRPFKARHSEPSLGDVCWDGVESPGSGDSLSYWQPEGFFSLSSNLKIPLCCLSWSLFIVLFFIYSRPTQAQTFSPIATSITPVTDAQAAWADMNNDRWPDLLISGTDHLGTSSLVYYANNGDSTFDTMEIAALAQVRFDLADYNQDGFIDLLVSGKTAGDAQVVRVYRNNSGASFTDMAFALEGIASGDVLWADLDHDARPEIVLSGLDALGDEVLLLYTPEGASYAPVSQAMTPQAYGSLAAMDANKDGLPELLVTGYDALSHPESTVYTFDASLAATLYAEVPDGYALNAVEVADLNEDGFPDLVMTGISGDLVKATNVYFNNQINGFTRSSMELDSAGSSSLALADLNQDGLPDLVLMGLDTDNNALTGYYTNAGAGGGYALTAAPHALTSLHSGAVALADFNRDGSLDVFQTGEKASGLSAGLYASDMHLSITNHPPAAPGDLSAVVQDGAVTLGWAAATDDLTHALSLTYNVYISASPGGADLVLSPLADVATGYRRMARAGNAGYATALTVRALPEGRYYWGVQAIDNAFQGSAFAGEATFVVCDPVHIGADTAVCHGETITLEAGEAGDVVNWYSVTEDELLAADVRSYDHWVGARDTLVAEVTRAGLGCVLYDTIVVDVKGPVALDPGPDFAVCTGDSATLTLTGFEQVNWYTEAGLLAADQSTVRWLPADPDTVVAEVFFDGGCVQYDTVVVDLYAPVAVDLGRDTALCVGTPLSLSLEGYATVNWFLESAGPVAADQASWLVAVETDDAVIAEGIDAHGCSGFDTLWVEALPLPAPDLGADTALCHGAVLELTVEGFEAVSWLAVGEGWLGEGPSLQRAVVADDTLVVEVQDAAGCVNRDTLVTEVLPLPVVDLGPDVRVCDGETVLLQLQDPAFGRVDWVDVAGNVLVEDQWFYAHVASADGQQETDTLVAVVTSVAGCVARDTLVVAVDPRPVVTLRDTTVCAGAELTLAVAGDWDAVNWYTAGDQVLATDQPVYALEAAASMTLWAEAILDGCAGLDTMALTVNPLPVVELGEERSYCVGDAISLAVDDVGVDYAWRNAAMEVLSSGPALEVTAAASDQFTLRVEDTAGCVYEDSVAVTVYALPEVEIVGDTEVCAETPVELSVDPADGAVVRWVDADDVTLGEARTLEAVLPASGPVYVRVEDTHQCVGRDTVEVVVHPLPVADAGEEVLICYGTGTTLGGTEVEDGLVFRWAGEAGLATLDVANLYVEPEASTWYFLEVTDGNGCVAEDSVLVEVNPRTVVDAGPDRVYCLGEALTIGGDPSASGSLLDYVYRWSPEEGLSSPSVPNPVVRAEADQTYVLSVTSGDCEAETDTVDVVVQAPPEVVVSPTQSIGAGASVRLQASGGVAYRWSPAELLDAAEVAEPLATPFKHTTFTVEVADALGCVTVDTVVVLVQNNLFIPNLFTPNGDGSNDFFRVYGSGVSELRFSVYDLNGELLYRSTQPEEALSTGWDGTSGGRPMGNGTYVWTIEGTFFDGSPLRINDQVRGTVRLLR